MHAPPDKAPFPRRTDYPLLLVTSFPVANETEASSYLIYKIASANAVLAVSCSIPHVLLVAPR